MLADEVVGWIDVLVVILAVEDECLVAITNGYFCTLFFRAEAADQSVGSHTRCVLPPVHLVDFLSGLNLMLLDEVQRLELSHNGS